MAGATLGDLMTGGTVLAWEEGTTGSYVANVAKDRIDRVLQVLKMVEVNLTGEGRCLVMMRLGGMEVGLEVSMMQVLRAQVDINRE